MRAIQAHQNLEKKCRDREEARLKGKKSGCKDDAAKSVESFLPPPEDGEYHQSSAALSKCIEAVGSVAGSVGSKCQASWPARGLLVKSNVE